MTFCDPVTFAPQTEDDDFFALLAGEEVGRFGDASTRFDDDPLSGWFPGERSPSPFDRSRLGLRVVPRVPIRLATGGEQAPEKIDPRAVRFTEIVEQILNGLITAGNIYKTNTGWEISFVVRQITDTEAVVGEDYFSTNRNRRCFKDADGVVHELY